MLLLIDEQDKLRANKMNRKFAYGFYLHLQISNAAFLLYVFFLLYIITFRFYKMCLVTSLFIEKYQ